MPVRSGRIARLARLGGMAAGLATDAAGAAGRVVARGAGHAAEHFHRQSAERIAAVLGDMKGLPQKVGQILSVLDDVVPAEHRDVYREVLGTLQAQAEPLTWAEVAPVVQEDLGQPLQALFASVQERAVAAASIGQVHRAVLHDGREVAVKVQYPGIQQALHDDLANLGGLVTALSAVLPRTSVEHLVREVAQGFTAELDYRREARQQQEAGLRWAGDPLLVVPQVVPEHSAARVLTTTWVDGLPFEQALLASPEARGAWGAALWRTTWKSVLEHAWVHGDPHPGNTLFLPGGRVALLDYGCAASLPPELVRGLGLAAERATAGADDLAIYAVLAPALGLPPDLDAEVAALWGRFGALLMEPVAAPQPFRFDRAYSQALVEQTSRAKLAMARTALWRGVPTPTTQGVVLLMRTIVGQAAVLSRLEAQADFRAAAELQVGPARTPAGDGLPPG